jgi:hypothetical protein
MTIDTSRAAVERILEGVTPGPWGCSMGKLVRIVKVVSRSPIVLAGVHRFGRNGGKATDGDCEANGRFIAAARDLVPALLAERDEYRDQIAELLFVVNREAVEQRARAEAAEAEVARLSHAHAAAERVQHIKRGSSYTVVGRGKVQTDTPLADYAEVVVYRGDDGQVWVRPVSEFEDGRFTVLMQEGR